MSISRTNLQYYIFTLLISANLMLPVLAMEYEDEATIPTSSVSEPESTEFEPAESTVQSYSQPKLNRITSLEDNCVESTCIGFSYPDVNDVAFFDLKDEVHIRHGPVYDLNKKLHMESLVFKDCHFAHFPLHLFYSIALSELDIRHCSVEIITWENFLLADQLKVLLLSDNRIEKITEMTFNYAYNLNYLFLDSNRISTLVSESFKGLENLFYLDLSKNQLRVLPDDVFAYLPALKELDLSQNFIHVIKNEHFAKNLNLLNVRLSENRLRDIGEYAFKNQARLMLLDISHNPQLERLVSNLQVNILQAVNCSLTRVNIYGDVRNVFLNDNQILELYFSQPETLNRLVLRRNSLQQIASLERANNLLTLDLADNPDLYTLPEPWNLDSLLRLDISNTSIQTIPVPSNLTEPSTLRYLNVSHNKIQKIEPLHFEYFENLKQFEIDHNDWNCYNLRLVMDMLIRRSKMQYTPDPYDPDFPGEYIGDIACMYRTVDAEREEATEKQEQEAENLANASLLESKDNIDAAMDVESLRGEFKAIIQFYEEKFDYVFKKMKNLNERLSKIEQLAQLNETTWETVAIALDNK